MFVLASASPRRKELMSKISSSFDIVKEDIDESQYIFKDPKETVLTIAFHKGEETAKLRPNDIVISADTIVVLGDKIIGKPKDKDDAFKILSDLSNKTHIVYTAYTIRAKNILHQRIIESFVTFNELSKETINKYIETGSPMDKAGAYGVQDSGEFNLIKDIKGSINNVIGFPVEEIIKDLKENKLL